MEVDAPTFYNVAGHATAKSNPQGTKKEGLRNGNEFLVVIFTS
jgi:hypothetical protein